jgi:hypothetical protein
MLGVHHSNITEVVIFTRHKKQFNFEVKLPSRRPPPPHHFFFTKNACSQINIINVQISFYCWLLDSPLPRSPYPC